MEKFEAAKPHVHSLLTDVYATVMEQRRGALKPEPPKKAAQSPAATCPAATVQVLPTPWWDGTGWKQDVRPGEPAAYATDPHTYGQGPVASSKEPEQVLAAYGQDPAAYRPGTAAYVQWADGQEPASYGMGEAAYGQDAAAYGQDPAAYVGEGLQRWKSTTGLEGYTPPDVDWSLGVVKQPVKATPPAPSDANPSTVRTDAPVHTVRKEADEGEEDFSLAPGVFASRLFRAGAHFELLSGGEVREPHMLEPLPPGVPIVDAVRAALSLPPAEGKPLWAPPVPKLSTVNEPGTSKQALAEPLKPLSNATEPGSSEQALAETPKPLSTGQEPGALRQGMLESSKPSDHTAAQVLVEAVKPSGHEGRHVLAGNPESPDCKETQVLTLTPNPCDDRKSTPVLAETPKPCENTGAQVCVSVCTDEQPVEMCQGGCSSTAGRGGSDPENPSAAPDGAAQSAPLPVGTLEGSPGDQPQSLPKFLGEEPLSECLQSCRGGAAEMDGQGSLGDVHSPDAVRGDAPQAADFGASTGVSWAGEKSVPDTPAKEEMYGGCQSGNLATHVSSGEVHLGTEKFPMDGKIAGANEAEERETGMNVSLVEDGPEAGEVCTDMSPAVTECLEATASGDTSLLSSATAATTVEDDEATSSIYMVEACLPSLYR